MDKQTRIHILKEHLLYTKVNYEEIMNLGSLKDAHSYCIIHNISSQKYGPLLEKFIRIKFNYSKNNSSNRNGDCSKDGINSEIKVSLGGALHNKFNYVQIRPSHDCEIYIFTAYNLSSENVENEGELYIFRIKKEDMKPLLIKYGQYAHGTKREHGNITNKNIDNNLEYALRTTINDRCWKELMKFRIYEIDL